MILLDTDICVEILRKNETVILRRAEYDDSTAISFMSLAELFYGAEKSSNPAANRRLIEEFLLTLEVIHSDYHILQRFGQFKKYLQEKRAILPDADIFIAATAYERAEMLVSGNTSHFERFPNLEIENWIQGH